MARRTIKIGSIGPLVFDDGNSFPDGDTHGLHVDRTPTEDTEVMRKVDVGGGAIAAPEDATYIVVSLTAGLTNERRIQAGTGLALDDGGANNDLTINHSPHAAEASLTDNTSGTANDTLQALTDPTDTPADADTLRDDLVANLIPELRNNLADLAAKVNAILTILRDQNILSS